ncbi:MAG: hypothetical protein B7C54_03570 [Acidimicrobiales bacterium mtb01]|nr:hypothetical protein [Actinomycetota bacterium]TEX47370.1 MAG: hypothetical protein B7C54_03570 [Acidimicrobiales bacterium mtb01]
MNIRLMAAVAVASLALVACGGDGDGTNDYLGGSSGGGGSDAESAFGQELTKALMTDSTGTFSSEEEASCVAGAMIREVGEGRLIELGLGDGGLNEMSNYGFTEAEFEKVVDAVFNCVDMRATIVEQLATDYSEEQANCVGDKIDLDAMRDLAKAELTGNGADMSDEFMSSMITAMTDCGISG